MRLDKYLKVSRIIKRRTVANDACDAAHICVNGRVAKASYDVKEGDVLYKIDSSAMDANLERALKSLSQAKDTYDEKLADRNDNPMIYPGHGASCALSDADVIRAIRYQNF